LSAVPYDSVYQSLLPSFASQMESAEAEKTAILAEIEEIAGLGKDKHVRSFFSWRFLSKPSL
jgi:hypothetical protein